MLTIHIGIKYIWQSSMYFGKNSDSNILRPSKKTAGAVVSEINNLINCNYWVHYMKPDNSQANKDETNKNNKISKDSVEIKQVSKLTVHGVSG